MPNLNEYAKRCHEANAKWWIDPSTGEPVERNTGQLLMLCVSELSEADDSMPDNPERALLLMQTIRCLSRAIEGHRKDLMDDKLPNRKMFEVELADCIIRILDMAAGFGLDIDGAFEEKMAYNAIRAVVGYFENPHA